jgi:outer membrane protein assembly factor BamA
MRDGGRFSLLSSLHALKRFFYVLVLCFCFINRGSLIFAATAADSSMQSFYRVDSIEIRGNTSTEPGIILRELTFRKGDSVSTAQLQYNRERIYSLGIFTQVSLTQKPESPATILIEVHESWYIWPIPFIEMSDHDWNHLTYGIDLSIANFQGKNQKIHVKYGFGYNPYLNMSYENPGLDSLGKYYFGFSAGFGKIKNKSDSAKALYGDDFLMRYYDIALIFGKRFNKTERLFWTVGYQQYTYPEAPGNDVFNALSPGAYPYTAIEYRFDSRDLSQNASLGIYFLGNVTYKGFGSRGLNYQSVRLDLSRYIPLGYTLVLKLHGMTKQVSGTGIPFYDLVYLGFDQRIRGQYSYHQEGKGFYFASADVKLPLINEANINFHLPIIPDKLQHFRTGLFSYIFVDAGSIHEEPYSLKGPSSGFGYGGGLALLILPYNIFRIEMAFDKHLKREVLVDFGTAF